MASEVSLLMQVDVELNVKRSQKGDMRRKECMYRQGRGDKDLSEILKVGSRRMLSLRSSVGGQRWQSYGGGRVV